MNYENKIFNKLFYKILDQTDKGEIDCGVFEINDLQTFALKPNVFAIRIKMSAERSLSNENGKEKCEIDCSICL